MCIRDRIKIAGEHYGPDASNIYRSIAERVMKIAANASGKMTTGKPVSAVAPSTAEYLDTVRACIDLGLSPDQESEWKVVSTATLLKRQTPA